MPNFVQIYKSTDANAPTLTGQTGSLITLLNKCLVDGYTTASVTSITRSSTTVTVTLAASNATLVTGNYITIAGANETQYNGTWQITVVNGTTVTYEIGTTPASPATGTITYAKAGLQWTKPFSAGTNAQTYRSADTGSNQFYLQVIDNGATAGGAKEAQIYGAEVMTADQTVSSGRFPTTAQASNGLCCRKSSTADGTARAWTLIGDDRTFYLITQTGDSAAHKGIGFGHLITFKAGDGYNTFIAGEATFNSANSSNTLANAQLSATGLYLARPYNQMGSSISCTAICLGVFAAGVIGSSSFGLVAYPNGPDSGFYCAPTAVFENGSLRGRLPGFYAPLHTTPFSNYDTITGVTGLTGVTLTAVFMSSSNVTGQGLFDTFGPWT